MIKKYLYLSLLFVLNCSCLQAQFIDFDTAIATGKIERSRCKLAFTHVQNLNPNHAKISKDKIVLKRGSYELIFSTINDTKKGQRSFTTNRGAIVFNKNFENLESVTKQVRVNAGETFTVKLKDSTKNFDEGDNYFTIRRSSRDILNANITDVVTSDGTPASIFTNGQQVIIYADHITNYQSATVQFESPLNYLEPLPAPMYKATIQKWGVPDFYYFYVTIPAFTNGETYLYAEIVDGNNISNHYKISYQYVN